MISVVVPCYNAALWIGETLRSVTEQKGTDLEIIAIDDGSTDETAEIIRREFPFVRLVTTRNQGVSRARNLGTDLAAGQFIQYLDADDLLGPGKLARQRKALEESGAEVAYGDWQRLVPAGSKHVLGPVISRQLSRPEVDLFGDFWWPLAAYLFRREIVERVGGWNERLPVIQDARYAFDCAAKGARFVFCPGVVAFYRTHSGGSVSTRSRVAFVRDCFRNSVEVEEWWKNNGGVDAARRAALLKSYGHVARASFEVDLKTFELAYEALIRLKPGYVPDQPRHLAVASRLFGYRHAETLALWYRRAKQSLTSLV